MTPEQALAVMQSGGRNYGQDTPSAPQQSSIADMAKGMYKNMNWGQRAGMVLPSPFGDIAGAGGDAYMMATQPDQRTWGNAGLAGLGLIPGIPAGMAGITKNQPPKELQEHLIRSAAKEADPRYIDEMNPDLLPPTAEFSLTPDQRAFFAAKLPDVDTRMLSDDELHEMVLGALLDPSDARFIERRTKPRGPKKSFEQESSIEDVMMGSAGLGFTSGMAFENPGGYPANPLADEYKAYQYYQGNR